MTERSPRSRRRPVQRLRFGRQKKHDLQATNCKSRPTIYIYILLLTAHQLISAPYYDISGRLLPVKYAYGLTVIPVILQTLHRQNTVLAIRPLLSLSPMICTPSYHRLWDGLVHNTIQSSSLANLPRFLLAAALLGALDHPAVPAITWHSIHPPIESLP